MHRRPDPRAAARYIGPTLAKTYHRPQVARKRRDAAILPQAMALSRKDRYSLKQWLYWKPEVQRD
jgi:hypothetical protein